MELIGSQLFGAVGAYSSVWHRADIQLRGELRLILVDGTIKRYRGASGDNTNGAMEAM